MSPDTKMGVYGIFRRGTGECYIGSSIDIHRRWRDHRSRLRVKEHHNKKLENAWHKYGPEDFEFRILELCEEAHMIEAEERWLQAFKPHYNLSYTPTKPMDEVARIKMRASMKGKPRDPVICAKIKATLRKKHRNIPAFGSLFSVSELAEKLNLPVKTVQKRLQRGWKPPQNE